MNVLEEQSNDAKAKILAMLMKRFPESTRSDLSLASVFDPRRQPSSNEAKDLREKYVDSLIERYAHRVYMDKTLLKVQFRKYHRAMKSFRNEEEFVYHVKIQCNVDPPWCKKVLQIKNKVKAISFSTADIERMFSFMTRIKTNATNKVDISLPHRMRLLAHGPTDLNAVDWDLAYELWSNKKTRYAKAMQGTKLYADRNQCKGLKVLLK